MQGRRGAPRALTSARLVRASLAHHRGPAVLLAVVTALVSAVTVFAAAYQQQVQQSLVDAAFAVDGPGNSWTLTADRFVLLPDVLPAGSDRLTGPPVNGRSSAVRWTTDYAPGRPVEVQSNQLWREDICAHLTLVSGRCPAGAAEVAISAADAEGYRVGTDEEILLGPQTPFTVTGVYRVTDPDDPYWFGNPPVGESLVDLAEGGKPRSDPLLTDRWSFYFPYQERLDVRLDRSALRLADLPEIAGYTGGLRGALAGQGQVVTAVPETLGRIAAERVRAVAGLTLSLVQVAVLVGVVLALLASVELSVQRAGLGLARLRGEPAARLRRLVTARWVVVVTAGWLVGLAPGLLAAGLLARLLPGERGLLVGPALLVAPPLVLLAVAAVILLPARGLLREPVIGLLRSAPAAARDAGPRALLVDVALLVLSVSGLLVALQVGTTSVLGLLVPSLIAIGLGVLGFRGMVRLAGLRHRRLTRSGRRSGALLTAAWTMRLRGLRLLVIGTTVAAAFVVLAVQLQAIGTDVRRHDAEVRTGAPVVLQVDGRPGAVVRALDRVDPRHQTADASVTAVVVTRREDPRVIRGLFVEPAAFARLAYGADRAADADVWPRITAPAVEPVVLSGDTVRVQVEDHVQLGRRLESGDLGTTAKLGLEYLSASGVARTAELGTVRLTAGPGQRFAVPIGCAAGCRLLRITVQPDGPMEGELAMTVSVAPQGGRWTPVDLGPADRWVLRPTAVVEDQLGLTPQPGGRVALTVKSGGRRLAVQHRWLPLTLPALVAADAYVGTGPTITTADQTPIPIDPVARTVDAVPGQLGNVAVADLETMLRGGQREPFSLTSVEVWVAESALGRLDELERALATEGVVVSGRRSAAQAVEDSRGTASALSGQIAPGLAALAGGFAALGIALTMAGHRLVLGRDLVALRRAGVRSRTAHRAAVRTYVGPALLAVALGAVAGAVGCVLVIGGLPLVADPQPTIHADLRLRVLPLLAAVAVAGAVVTAVVLVVVRRLERGPSSEPVGGGR